MLSRANSKVLSTSLTLVAWTICTSFSMFLYCFYPDSLRLRSRSASDRLRISWFVYVCNVEKEKRGRLVGM